MRARFDVTSIGEAFVDFISSHSNGNLAAARSFVKVAGGAPANVAVGVARLGLRSAFAGKVGRDSFGKFVLKELGRAGVDTKGVVEDKKYKTRLAFVSVTSDGDRDFEFWEQHPADQQLRTTDVDIDRITVSTIVNIGAFMLLNQPARSTAFSIVRQARHRGCDVCFDPNVRLSLWRPSKDARRIFRQMVSMSSIARMNVQEARWLTGTRTIEKSARKLHSLGPKMVFITLAEKGCFVSCNSWTGFIPGYSVKAIDTTGCGDGFLAGILYGICRTNKRIDDLTGNDVRSVCRYANAAGALTSLKRGAISALPSLREVNRFLQKHKAQL